MRSTGLRPRVGAAPLWSDAGDIRHPERANWEHFYNWRTSPKSSTVWRLMIVSLWTSRRERSTPYWAKNGAGKTTLMNILYGLYHPDGGRIRWRGESVRLSSPKDAIGQGIGMVHQHFMLIPALSVTENIILGLGSVRRPLLDVDSAAQRISSLSEEYGLDVDPRAAVCNLSVGAQQRVEIVKALYRGADLFILDEPTSVLTPQEVEGLFGVLRRLVAEGHSVIFITHKLDEVMEISDRVHRSSRRQAGIHRQYCRHLQGRVGPHDGRARDRLQGGQRGAGSWREQCWKSADSRSIWRMSVALSHFRASRCLSGATRSWA